MTPSPGILQRAKAVIPDEMLEGEEWFGIKRETLLELTPFQRRFLFIFPSHMNVKAAAEAAGISPHSHMAWKAASALYKICWQKVMDAVVEMMEVEAIRRGMHGVTEKIYYQGQECGERQVYSDTLLTFMLRAANPDKYRDRSTMEFSTPPAVPTDSEFASLPRGALIELKQVLTKYRNQGRVVEAQPQQETPA